jgi:3-methyladenine DNA glycosylase Mpg
MTPHMTPPPTRSALSALAIGTCVHAPELNGYLLVKRQASGELVWGVIVETEADAQDEPVCHGHRRRTPSNDTPFGEPGRCCRTNDS